MMKHIAKHNDKSIVVVYREVPNESHMCLVVYSNALPQMIHDELMKVLESPAGQSVDVLGEALWRHIMPSGHNTLEYLHHNKLMKKVPTNQVIMTPTPKSRVRLDELNNILNEMKQGEDAVRRLAELDKNSGLVTRKVEPREVGVPLNSYSTPASVETMVLTDEDLAKQRMEQAAKLKANAELLIEEANRLVNEAQTLVPTTVVKTKAKRVAKNVEKKANAN